MIPKKIHYCWLSGEPLPKFIQDCMASWKQMLPDYEWILWDQRKFDVSSVPFVKQAVNHKKWPFAADYIRLFAVYSEGGFYFDTDIIVKKNIDAWRSYDFVSAIEYHPAYVKEQNTLDLLHSDGTSKKMYTHKPGIGVQAAFFGATQEHPYLKRCIDFYQKQDFDLGNGCFYDTLIAPDVYAMFAEEFGFRFKNEMQELPHNMVFFPTKMVGSTFDDETPDTHLIHSCAGSWRPKTKHPWHQQFLDQLKTNPFLRKIFGKSPL
jgi:hypothetical protein